MRRPERLDAEGGLVLRPWLPSDVPRIFEACQDPQIQRWTTVPVPYTRDSAESFVAHSESRWESARGALFGVFDPAGDLVASVGLVALDLDEATAEVGYWTAPWARGRGVVVSATRALVRWAFEELRLERVEWTAEVGNEASRRAALRAGFVMEGTARSYRRLRDGRRADHWTGSVLPQDLATDQQPGREHPPT